MHQAESLQSDGQHAWTCTIRKVFGDFLVAYGGMDFHTENAFWRAETLFLSLILCFVTRFQRLETHILTFKEDIADFKGRMPDLAYFLNLKKVNFPKNSPCLRAPGIPG